MRFHKIEMVGFKSFPDKTTVTFQPGMTAVVGPNGCGKSNISDAIRWVLGEKSAKNLRGDKMEDVIFNGSDARHPIGMAEVSLSLQGLEGAGTLGFTEFKEVTITRRLYRNGDSEYLINKIPCRLKDVRDLLMDTGVGSRAYSIIEQGRIGQIITSKPEERRYIIEEVAGITKYKSRKVEALSKLKETEDNLARVNDIIHEVKRQIDSLDRQARKAERYKKLSAELRGVELKMAWDDFSRLAGLLAEADVEFERLTAEGHAAKNSVAAREADLSEARLRLAESERGLMEHQREIHRVESEVSRLEARAEVAKTQLGGLDEQEGRIAAERGQLAREEAELSAQSLSLKEEEQALKAELDRLKGELTVQEYEFQSKADMAHELETRIERGRTRLFDVQAEAAQTKNRLARLEEKKTELTAKAGKAHEEERETAEKRERLKVEVEKKRMELDEATSQAADIEREIAALSGSTAETKGRLKEIDDEIEKGRGALANKSSRLHSLRELEESLEGYGEGVKALVAEGRRGAVPGLHGLVSDMLQTGAEHERAIEALLGDRLQGIVVEGHDDARGALEFLKLRGAGRGTFIPRTPRAGRAAPESLMGRDGVIGPAISLVRVKEGYEDVVKALLGDALVVRDMDSALILWSEGAECDIATLDGEVVEWHGALTGGVNAGGGVLSKKREIRELSQEVESISDRNRRTQELRDELSSELERAEARMKSLQVLIGDKRIAAVGLEKDLNALREELGRIEKKTEVLAIEAEQRTQEEAEISRDTSAALAALSSLDEERLDMEGRAALLVAELKTMRAGLETDREALTAKKMELSALIQKHESSARDIKRADLHREELARKAERLTSEESEIAARRAGLLAGRKEAEENINVLMRTALELKENTPALQDAYNMATEAIAGLETAVKDARREEEAVRGAATELEISRAEMKLKSDHISETVSRNYHIAIAEIEDAIKQSGIDREEAEMNASELRIKLERMGPVNIGAIEEYNELMERFNFLKTQKDDLDSSVARLREAIKKINKTSEELFMEAFEAINERFKTVFVSLFGGGKAELQLSQADGVDVLESGLEIVAQPPGKRLQHLSLFSGGEKALIAAALTFSCFLVKPSPFCVLDEVDAPLDESNVQRFGNMLKQFADKTQFIVITHSRPTMELADALYGVTMDEPGVSRLVSVRLKEAAEMAGV